MTTAKLEINDKVYKVDVVETEEEAVVGLSKAKELDENQGMLFPFEEEGELQFTMADTKIALDIIFIDSEGIVTKVVTSEPLNLEEIKGTAIDVLELKAGSGVESGDYVEYLDDRTSKTPEMIVLGANGETQMVLEGGERIFSRKSTKIIIKKSKKALQTKSDNDYRSLGRYVINELNALDNREPQYVETKD